MVGRTLQLCVSYSSRVIGTHYTAGMMVVLLDCCGFRLLSLWIPLRIRFPYVGSITAYPHPNVKEASTYKGSLDERSTKLVSKWGFFGEGELKPIIVLPVGARTSVGVYVRREGHTVYLYFDSLIIYIGTLLACPFSSKLREICRYVSKTEIYAYSGEQWSSIGAGASHETIFSLVDHVWYSNKDELISIVLSPPHV